MGGGLNRGFGLIWGHLYEGRRLFKIMVTKRGAYSKEAPIFGIGGGGFANSRVYGMCVSCTIQSHINKFCSQVVCVSLVSQTLSDYYTVAFVPCALSLTYTIVSHALSLLQLAEHLQKTI